jgi:hypothetical protein
MIHTLVVLHEISTTLGAYVLLCQVSELRLTRLANPLLALLCYGASSMNAASGLTASCAAAGSQASAAAGLVPSKTKQNALVSFAPSVVAERRVKRLKKSVWASGHLHGIADNGHRPPVVWFVTLTYRGVSDWQASHIRDAVNKFRDWCKVRRVPCRYTWVAELQGRGAVHYHLLAWLPHGVRMPMWDRRTVTPSGKRMACWWPHGMTNRQVAKSGVGYLMKYLSKLGELTRFPKGLRLYGIGGLNQQGRAVRSWYNLPEWVKLSHGVGEVTRAACGFVVRATGEILEPAFKLLRVPFGAILRPLRELPARFHDGAYSSVTFA